MKLSLIANPKAFLAEQDRIARNIDFATAVALTRTAQQIKTEAVFAMSRVFDRPTPFTLNSLEIKPATKANQEAFVQTKEGFAGVPAGRYLAGEVLGGPRHMKSHERKLRGYTSPGEFADLDQYGGIRGSTYTKILSQLSLLSDTTQNASNSKRSKGKRKREAFFRRENVVYQRRDDEVRPYLIITDPPKYRKRFPFFEIGAKVFDQFLPEAFERELEAALK